jgi:hypothetical protein
MIDTWSRHVTVSDATMQLQRNVATFGHAADRVVPDCRGAGNLVRHAHRTGPSSLTVKAGRGHGAEVSGRPGRDTLMPPRLKDELQDGRVPEDRERSGDGHQPALIQRPGLRLAAGGPERGCGCPARPNPARRHAE